LNYVENIPISKLEGFALKAKSLAENFSKNADLKKLISSKGNKSKMMTKIAKAKLNFIPVEFIIEPSLPCAYKGKKISTIKILL